MGWRALLRRWVLFAGAGALLSSVVLVLPRDAAADGFNVVVNDKNGVSSLSRSDLKRIVSGATKTWDNGAVVHLGIIPNAAPETQYLASLLETSPRELLILIQQQVFKGELRRPQALRSSADCAAFAANATGAICVASSGTAVPPGARIVPIR